MRLFSILVEEPIAIFQPSKLIRHDAWSYRANYSTFNSPFSKYADEQVHIVDAFVQVFDLLYYLKFAEYKLSSFLSIIQGWNLP